MKTHLESVMQFVCTEVLDRDFNVEDIADDIIVEFGVDAGEIIAADIIDLSSGNSVSSSVIYSDLAFACQEALASYSVGELDDEEYVRACFTALLYAEAMKHGHGELECILDSLGRILFQDLDRGDSWTRIRILKEVVCHTAEVKK